MSEQDGTSQEQDGANESGQESSQNANAGGQSGGGGFKAITSDAELSAWKAETRKQIVTEVKRTLKAEADQARQKEQGEYKDLYERTLTSLKAERAERLVTAAATKANAIRPDAISRLVGDALDYDDDGKPTNVDAVLAQAKKDYPELFRAAAGGGDGGRGGQPDPKDANAVINAFLRGSRA